MKNKIIIGIQGGKGSYNELALSEHMANKEYSVKYLYTTKNVLKELEKGTINLGQFAISNTLGGVVDESIETLGMYKFKLKDKYIVKVSHSIMIHPEASIRQIDTIMSHPQAFAQCKKSLAKKYFRLKQVVGTGKLIDPAYLASQLSKKKIPMATAVLGNKILAEKYNLEIVEENLQDKKDNYTTFLLVSKYRSKITSVLV